MGFVMTFCKFTIAGTFVNVAQESGSAILVVVCRLKLCADIGHEKIKLPALSWTCSEGEDVIVNAKFCTVNCALVDVPPTMPIKNSFV